MGTPGHMKHPFDVSRVKTGQDLINYFTDIKEFLELNPGSLKIDGINVSFKLITTENGNKEFRMDRGTTHTESVIGMDAEGAYKKWPEGHGMPPAIKTLLEIFNEALPSIKYELRDLEMWDDPTKFFNTEYVAGKTNVQKYDKNFLAIHGINQFYEKKGPKKWVETGKSMDRPGKERPTDPKTGKPVKAASTEISYNRGALESLIKKVKPFASQHGFEIYGDVPTELTTEIDFSESLGSPLTVQMTAEDQETHSLGEWLSDTLNPGRAKVTKSDGKQIDAISKDIYMAVLNEIPLMEYLQSPEDVKMAINGAIFNHATRMLGNDVKSALDSSMGSVADHEGVVLRGMEDFPVKVTGEFIVGGMQTAFREGVIKEVEELKGIKDVEEDLDIETVNLDEPEEKRKIALIPGGFKPPHRGHVALVTHYLDEVAPSGKVILFMGSGGATPRTIHGKAITYEDALEIWKIYLNNENIAFPNEILEVREVKGGPIGAVIDYVTEADPDKEVIYLGAGEKDAERWKFMMDNPKYNPNNVKVFIEPVPNYNDKEGAPMSATNFRKAIENGEEELIKSYMPESSHDSYREIMDVFEGRLKEDQQPLGIFLRLIEETINEKDLLLERPPNMTLPPVYDEKDDPTGEMRDATLKSIAGPPNVHAKIDPYQDEILEVYKSYERGTNRQAYVDAGGLLRRKIFKQDTPQKIIDSYYNEHVLPLVRKVAFATTRRTGPLHWKYAAEYSSAEDEIIDRMPMGMTGDVFKHELGHAIDHQVGARLINPLYSTGGWGMAPMGQLDTHNKYFPHLRNTLPKRFSPWEEDDPRTKPAILQDPHPYMGHEYKMRDWNEEIMKKIFPNLYQPREKGELPQKTTNWMDKISRGTIEHSLDIQDYLRGGTPHHAGIGEIYTSIITTRMANKRKFTARDIAFMKSPTFSVLRSSERGEGPWPWKADLMGAIRMDLTRAIRDYSDKGLSNQEIADLLNQVAKVEVPQQPTKMVAENFLNIVEETINETPVSDMTNMYGFASGNLSNITPGGFEVEEEEEEDVEEVEEEPTAKDALEAMLDAIKKVAEENGIEVGEDEELEEMSAMGGGAVEGPGMCANDKKKETLIREVEDYLLSTLGDIL